MKKPGGPGVSKERRSDRGGQQGDAARRRTKTCTLNRAPSPSCGTREGAPGPGQSGTPSPAERTRGEEPGK